MDPKMRLLPHLNVYFLQRRAYEQHRKKIECIRGSGTRTRTGIKNTDQKQHRVEGQDIQEGMQNQPIKYSFHTIKEEIKAELNPRLTPWAKRQREETLKQNNRLMNRLQKCASTINRREIQQHRMKSQEIKERISKFTFSPSSNKTLMKCKHSLEILRQKEKRREDHSQEITRHHSRLLYSKTQLSQLQRYGSSERLSTQPPLEKKSSQEKYYLLKNSNKIKSHSENKNQPRQAPRKRFYNSQNSSKKHLKSSLTTNRNNCFSTQIQP